MNILSLFDGISCGRAALEKAGVPVTHYFASEIDKHAITVSRKNWPDIVQLGDVTGLSDWFIENMLPTMDAVIAGSPCQGFSFAGKQLNFNDPRSALFFEFVRIWKACVRRNPDCKFLLENVQMKSVYSDVITDCVGVGYVKINSALVCAQNRRRLYWTNICEVQQPIDRGIFLDSILLNDAWPVCLTERRTEEARRIRSESLKAGRDFSPRRGKELAARTDRKSNCLTATFSDKEHLVLQKLPCIKSYGQLIYRPDKSQCLDANYWKGADNHGQRTGYVLVPSGLIGLGTGDIIPVELSAWRKLDPIECERLQGLPDNYTAGISDTQRYKALGNGWQVDTVAHIFSNL